MTQLRVFAHTRIDRPEGTQLIEYAYRRYLFAGPQMPANLG